VSAESLWKVSDQAERLVELTSDDAEAKEAPLRRDVRSLGYLLGKALKQQAGEELFESSAKRASTRAHLRGRSSRSEQGANRILWRRSKS
jgi:phosphoenolpyruvate carboxylase